MQLSFQVLGCQLLGTGAQYVMTNYKITNQQSHSHTPTRCPAPQLTDEKPSTDPRLARTLPKLPVSHWLGVGGKKPFLSSELAETRNQTLTTTTPPPYPTSSVEPHLPRVRSSTNLSPRGTCAVRDLVPVNAQKSENRHTHLERRSGPRTNPNLSALFQRVRGQCICQSRR